MRKHGDLLNCDFQKCSVSSSQLFRFAFVNSFVNGGGCRYSTCNNLYVRCVDMYTVCSHCRYKLVLQRLYGS